MLVLEQVLGAKNQVTLALKFYDKVFLNIYISATTEHFHILNITMSYHNLTFRDPIHQSQILERILRGQKLGHTHFKIL